MQISPHIHAIRLPFFIDLSAELRLPRSVWSYIVNRQTLTLIDAGVKGSEAAIFDQIGALGRREREIRQLVFTHAHPDHIGGGSSLVNGRRIQTFSHPAGRAWIEAPDTQFVQRPVPGFHRLVGGPVPIDCTLEDGARLDAGGLVFEVLHTPGHSACSLSLFCPEEGVLITGDALPCAGDLPIYEDLPALIHSLERLAALPGIQHLLSSLDTPCSGADEIERRFAGGRSWLEQVHRAVRGQAEAGIEPMELCRRVVAALDLPPAAANPLIARSLQAHLPLLDQPALFS